MSAAAPLCLVCDAPAHPAELVPAPPPADGAYRVHLCGACAALAHDRALDTDYIARAPLPLIVERRRVGS